jgi:hypothetical protein
MILSIAGCAPAADGTEKIPTPQETAGAPSVSADAVTPEPTAAPSPAPLAALSGITAQAVRQISVYGDSQPTGTPEAVYCTDADVPAVLGWLQGIQATDAALSSPATEAPGDWKTYDVELFDGTIVTVSFAGDTLSVDGAAYTYTAPAVPDITRQLQLVVGGDSFSADTEVINYSVVNSTGDEAVLLFVPTLGRASETGWEKLDCAEGFCGVPDPIEDPVVEHELPLKEWFPDAGAGIYRLSLLAYDENGDSYMIADIFEIK